MYVIQVKGKSALFDGPSKLLYHKVYLFKPSKKEIEKAVKACEYKDDPKILDIGGIDLSFDYEVNIIKLKFCIWR